MIEQKIVEQTSERWATGDLPVREAIRAAFLIDGRMTMLEICIRFLQARDSIHIASWGLTPDMLLVRGKHHRAGPDGSPEQEELLAWLRSKGLTEEDISFWLQSEELSVVRVLAHAVERGVDVKVLLWNAYSLPFHPGPKQVQEQLEAEGICCSLDDSHRDLLNHPIESLHQKTIVVDDRYAFVGGIDLMIENSGDYDRWDTKGHPYYNPLRLDKDGHMPHSWHDVHAMFEGPVVADVARNFRQRWNEVAERHQLDPSLLLSDGSADMTQIMRSRETIPVQVVRTIPGKNYAFAGDEGIATILESYYKAFTLAQRSIYIENQYFWRRTFLGIENPLLGPPHADMEQLFQALVDALERGVSVTLMLPDNPNVGRNFTDDGLNYLWELSPRAVASGALQVYTLGSCLENDGRCLYRPIYIHAKVAIIDDQWITLGSANLNNRGMRDDAELNVAIQHPQMAQGLRILLMAEHLGLCDEDTLFNIVEIMGRTQPSSKLKEMDAELQAEWQRLQGLLGDPFKAQALFVAQAKVNLEAIKAKKALNGHLLPYIRHDVAADYEIEVDPVNGWLERLPDNNLPDEKQEHDQSSDAIN